jgi:hypothetical protein
MILVNTQRRFTAQLVSGSGRTTRRLSGDFKPSSPWPHIEEFIESGGNISIGCIAPIKCAAVASDDHNMLAALSRNPGETFNELMNRLDRTIDLAIYHDAQTDKINPP